MRLDVYLFSTGQARSRTHAANLIQLNRVTVNGVLETRAAREITESDRVETAAEEDYASLGGVKLAAGIRHFDLMLQDKIAVDIGAANGGFTDVLLKNGAKRVYAVDVGDCALPDFLKEDAHIVVKDRINARYITPADIGEPADCIVVDVSFISLTLIVPALLPLLKADGILLLLVKPQFEAGKKALTKTGIVKSEKEALASVEKVRAFCLSLGLKEKGTLPAPHPFQNKNKEYLLYLAR